jgi:hypothetical protein
MPTSRSGKEAKRREAWNGGSGSVRKTSSLGPSIAAVPGSEERQGKGGGDVIQGFDTLVPGTAQAHRKPRCASPPEQMSSRGDERLGWMAQAFATWDKRHGAYIQNFGREDTLCSEARIVESEEKYMRGSKRLWTYAANQPEFERLHGTWRKGIPGYTGYQPHWAALKDFFTRPLVGKLHPPYMPATRSGIKKKADKLQYYFGPAGKEP